MKPTSPLEMCEDWTCPSGKRCKRQPREDEITRKTVWFPQSSARGKDAEDCVFFLDRRALIAAKR